MLLTFFKFTYKKVFSSQTKIYIDSQSKKIFFDLKKNFDGPSLFDLKKASTVSIQVFL